MSVPVNDNLGINSPKATDSRNMKFVSGASTPYASVSEAHAAITYKSAGVPIYIVLNGKTVEHQYVGGLALENLVVFDPPANFYYDGNFFTGEITANSPFTLAPTGIEGGTYTNPVVTVNDQGQVTAIEDGTGGGTITSFITDTDIEITDYTKGIIQYSANGKKWKRVKNDDGTDNIIDVFGIEPRVFYADFTGTVGTIFDNYTPNIGKAHNDVAVITLDGSGHATYPNNVAQITIDESMPRYRTYSMVINSLNTVFNNYFAFTILRSSDNSQYVYVAFYYVDSTHMGINILTQSNGSPLALGNQFAPTFPLTAHVDYTSGGGKISAYVNGGTGYVSATVPSLVGLKDFAAVGSTAGGVLDSVTVSYSPFTNPTVLSDTFTGGAGVYTGHTPDVGTATMFSGGPFTPLNIDGSGNLIFDATSTSSLSGLKPNGALTPNRRMTVVLNSIPTAAGTRMQGGVLNSTAGDTKRNVALQYIDSTHVALTIQNSFTGAPIIQNTSLAVTYPLTWITTYNGTNITTSINGTSITTTDLGTDFVNYFDFLGVGGGSATSIEILNL